MVHKISAKSENCCISAGAAALTPLVGARRRTLLKSSASWRALLTVQAAMSVGIVLAKPAHAATPIAPTNSGYSLGSPSGNPFYINSGTLVSSSGNAIYGSDFNWTITNNGSVTSGAATGIYLKGPGLVSNGGSVTGHNDGIYFQQGPGSVSNSGVILGATYNGVELHRGGSVANAIDGTISGGYAGVKIGYLTENAPHAGSVGNAGTILGNIKAGVIMYGGGTLGNSGVIIESTPRGYGVALYTPESTVTNTGFIKAGQYGQGVRLNNGGYLYNSGTIKTGLKGEGVYLRDGGEALNSGVIYSGIGIRGGAMSSAYVGNIGVIGGSIGVQLLGGGYVNNTYANNGGVVGTIIGAQFGVQVGDGGSVANWGYIRAGSLQETYGVGVQLTHGGAVYNVSEYSGDFSLVNGSIVGGNIGVEISGASGYVYNGGTIIGGRIGVALNDGGVVDNNHYYTRPSCVPFNAYGTIIGGEFGVYGGSLSAVEVINEGLISGGSVGVDLAGGGAIYNDAGALISGDTYGVHIFGAAGTVYNTGNIVGGDIGVYLSNGGSVFNAGSISGDFGVAMTGTPGYVYNSGSIFGSEVGVYLRSGGSLINAGAGTIEGFVGVYTGPGDGNFFETNGSSDVTGQVVNYGSIFGVLAGVVMNGGGYLSNASTGTISSAFGDGGWGVLVQTPSIGSTAIYNAGIIQGQSVGVGVYNFGSVYVDNQLGGSISGSHAGIEIQSIGIANVNNSGSIGGGFAGVFIDNSGSVGSAYVTNAGSIQGGGFGVFEKNGSYDSVINLAGGSISAGFNGVFIDSYGSIGIGIVSNAGSISADDTGVHMKNGSYTGVFNLASGVITGGNQGVYVYRNNGNYGFTTISNAGSIFGGNVGVSVEGGTNASVTNLEGGTIQGGVQGVSVIVDGTASVENSGVIDQTGFEDSAPNFGVYIDATTAIVSNNAGGVIAGYYDGVYARAEFFNMTNAGTVLSAGDGVYADANYVGLTNSGTILSYYDGVRVDNETQASIFNEVGGTIWGYQCGIGLNAGSNTLVNAGLIEGYHWKGVEAYGTQFLVSNLQGGTIIGSHDGIYTDADNFSLDNAGLIYSTDTQDYEAAVRVKGDGASNIVNEQTGTITGQYSGVYVEYGSSANVTNAGLITGAYAVALFDTKNSLVNLATGTIAGGEDGAFMGTGAQVYNAGVIEGASVTGVVLFYGGNLENAAGGTISGGQYGVSAGYTMAGSFDIAGTVFNAGLITGGSVGVDLINGGQVSNFAGGVITGGTYGVNVGYAGSTVANAGTVFNSGLIEGGTTGLLLNNGGAVVNLAGATISGGTTGIDLPEGGPITNAGLITGGQDGIDVASGQMAEISNSGTIIGTAGTGVSMPSGGSLTNSATGLIQGGTDGVIAGSGSTIVNAGQILDAPALGHAGVLLDGASSLTNLAGGTIAGEVGVLVTGNAATITDSGAIISTDGGDAIQIEPNVDPAQITLTTGATLSGAIDGGGTDGQITLTGQNTLDDTISNFGTGSALTIAPGATWTGAGNWTIANVNNTGTFQGGMLNVPLTLTGNFTSTGTLQVIVTPTTSSEFNISGTATLSGGLTYIFAPGLYTPGKTYNFLVAAGGASGEFTDVTYIGATPYYVSKTTNLLISGNTLGSDLVLGRVAPLDDSVFADENQNQALLAQSANDELLSKASSDAGANAAACAAAEKVMPDATSPRGTSLASQMTSAVANAFCGAGGWIEATGSTMTIDNPGDGAGYSSNDAGFLAGLDRDMTSFDTKLGIAVGYDDAWLNDKGGGKATSDTFRIGLYAAQPLGAFTLEGDIMYGHANDTTTRATGIGATGASFGSNIYNGGAQINTNLLVNGVAVTPAAGIKFASANADGFNETSSTLLTPFEVSGTGSSYTSVQPYVNLGLSKIFTTESQVTITPQATVGYTLEAGNRGKAVTVTAPDGTVFSSGHTNLDAGAAQVEAGISAGKNNWALYGKYSALLSGNYTIQAGEAGLQIKF